ncbi:MAG: hypothetical protein Q4C70_01940 [Planctomycetia bacterium]|nr:hypothetical protein [Planctomycetia bacterium]
MATFMTTLKNIYRNCTLNQKRMGERCKTLCRIEPLEERTLLSAVSMATNPIQTENPWDSPSAIIESASLSTSTPTVNFSLANNSNNSSYFVEEGDDLELTLVRDNTEGSVTVFYVVDDYSSTSCRAGVDFNSTANYSNPAAVTFADGSDTATITISTTDDVFIENPEYFNVSLIYYPNYYSCDYVLNSSAATSISCTIEDNDDWSVSVTQTGESMYEMNGTASMGNNYSLSNPKFTISHTGITDPNDSYAPELKVFFNLSGTAVSDDYDLCRDRISYSKYYNTYNEFSFNGENSFDLYVNPYNNANEEDDETVILTLITNPNSWGDAGSNYQISGTTSKTITILDDDHFDITIEAVDNITTERIEEGDKDYGYFKVSRVANDNRTVLDTTYQVSVMLEGDSMVQGNVIPGTSLYCATLNTDYEYSVTPLDSNDDTNYIAGITTSTNNSYYDSNNFYIGSSYNLYANISSGKNEGLIRVKADFDWDDEGELFNGTNLNKAYTQSGEFVQLTVKSATWGSNGNATFNSSGDNKTASIEIKDGAIFQLAPENGYELFNSQNSVIRHNSDDDNRDGIVDKVIPEDYVSPISNAVAMTQAPTLEIENENDLVRTRMAVGLEYIPAGYELDVYFACSQLNIWSHETKGNKLLNGVKVDNRTTEATRMALLTSNNSNFITNVFVESPSQYSGNLNLHTEIYDEDSNCQSSYSESVSFMPISLNPYTPDTTYIDPMILPDATWRDNGVGIRRNLDSDETQNENDLIRVNLEFDLRTYNYTYHLVRSSSNLDLWKNAQGTDGYTFNENNEVRLNSPCDVWVEYTSSGNTVETLTFEVRFGDTLVYEEEMEFRPFNGITMAFVGELATAGDNVASPGINDWVIQELQAGYDVHVWDDGYDFLAATSNPDCNAIGEGRAFDELCAAINLRGQTNVALVGHSHGGGSVYHLSRRMAFDGQYNAELERTFDNRITQNYQLKFTSYIDAVRNDHDLALTSEARLPVGTSYHLNQYQTVPWYYQLTDSSLSNGTVVIGAENWDRTGLGVNHVNIDENPQVLELLKVRFEAHMIR